MQADELEAELSLLLDQMEGDYGDRHEIYMRLTTLIHQFEAMGMPAPEDLTRLVKELEADFAAEQTEGQ